MDFWQIVSTILGGITVGQFVLFLKKRDGIEEPDHLFWGKILLYVIAAVFVLGITTNMLFSDPEMIGKVRSGIWLILFMVITRSIYRLPPGPKTNKS